MDSESSEDENLTRFREAADNEFMRNLYTSSDNKVSGTSEVKGIGQKISLRPAEDTKFNNLNVTPEFQKFIATRLMSLIDSQIREIVVSTDFQTRDIEGGIHLFSSSENFVSELDLKQPRPKLSRYSRKDKCDIPEDLRCQEAAVTAEWILSREAINGWEKNTKGKLETLAGDEVEIKTGSTGKQKCGSSTLLAKEEKKERKRLKKQRLRAKIKLKKLNGNNQEASSD